MFKKLFAGIILTIAAASAFGQSAIIRGEESAGSYLNLKSTSGVLQTIVNSGSITAVTSAVDPCQASSVPKVSAIINVAAAATTQLVALSGTTIVYVCGFHLTISQVVTTANTLRFVYGTGASCGTGTANLTGDFGAGGVTAAPPLVISTGMSGTLFKTIAGQALCIITAIGGSGTFQGVITYVQI